jgi:hypothetical protein
MKTTKTTESPEIHAVLLRLPIEMHREIRENALREHRTVTAQVIWMLERQMEKP